MGDSALHGPTGGGPVALDLRIRGLTVRFDGRDILRELDLDVMAGETTCLLGPSGIGKSTLLRRIAGLLAGPGAIEAGDGQGLAGRIAFMGQSDLLLPWLDVAGNVMLGARLRSEPASGARLREMLGAVGLADAAAKRPAALSGGMRQRAALARTLMEDRPLVLMDEPFSAVDALTRLKLQDLAARLLAGRTVLLVTHDPWEAIRIGHRIVVIAGSPARVAADLRVEGLPPRAVDSETARALWRRLVGALEPAA